MRSIRGSSDINSHSNDQKLSLSLQKGVAAIFGPDDESTAVHAANICDTKEIPYIDTRSDASSAIPIVNMYPDPESIAQMVTDLVLAAEWQSFTILYETPEWLPPMSNLLQLYDPKGDMVTVKRIDVGAPTKNYRAVLREVKMSDNFCIVIECSIDSLGEILKQVRKSEWNVQDTLNSICYRLQLILISFVRRNRSD